jgi:large subunit ribosomal protein L4
MTLTLDLRSAAGETTGTVQLDEAIFGIQPNVPVMHQVVNAQLAAARAGTQSTKTRAEVSGGGKKPFKQKGTGRARQGSERAPHFAGGGVALGPKPRSYRQKTPRKMIQLALRSALSDRAAEDRILVVDSWPWEIPSTRDAKAAISSLGIAGRVLVVLTREDEEAYKSFRNLSGVQVMLDAELNAYDILCSDWVVFTAETLPGGGVEVGASPAASDESGAGSAEDLGEAGDPEPDAEEGRAVTDTAEDDQPDEAPQSVTDDAGGDDGDDEESADE